VGEARNAQPWLFEPQFNSAVKVRVSDERITSDAGLLLLREADHRLGLTEHLATQLVDPRRQDRIRYALVELLRERLYGLAMGYSTQDDADRLAHDPAMKLAAWDRPGEQALEERLASQPTQSRLLDILTHHSSNRAALRDSLAECCARHLRATGGDTAARQITLDVDSFPIQVHGQQPGAAYNGHYKETAGDYDGMQEGHRLGNGFVHAILRQGQVHTAQGVLRFFKEALRLTDPLAYMVDVRIDAGYVHGEVLDWLSERKVRFLGRIKTNAVLEELVAPHLARPAGRPPKEGYQKIIELGPYQAESWKYPQRLVLVVTDRPDPKTGQLNLLPNYFFLIVGWKTEELSGEEALSHYRQRGTFEDRLGEFQPSDRRAPLACRLPRERDGAALGAIGIQPCVDVADRIRRRRWKLFRPSPLSARRAQGGSAGHEACAATGSLPGASCASLLGRTRGMSAALEAAAALPYATRPNSSRLDTAAAARLCQRSAAAVSSRDC